MTSAQFTKEAFTAGYEVTVGKGNSGPKSHSYADVAADPNSKSLKTDWSNLVGEQKIPYHKPILKEGKRFVLLLKLFVTMLHLGGRIVLLGYLRGMHPTMVIFKAATNLLWGTKWNVEVMTMGKEAFLFKFHNVDTRNWVLKSGP